jgi:hypothetical protein
MSQQSLFDESIPHDADPEQHGREQARRDDVEQYMRRKDRQEMREREQNNNLHGQAVRGADKVAILRWAINADDPDLPSEAHTAAMRAKRRLDTLQEARQQTLTPSDPGFIPLRDSNADLGRWPFDDDPQEIPSSSTRRSDYEAYLAGTFVADWKHVIPTHVLEEAQTADPSLL